MSHPALQDSTVIPPLLHVEPPVVPAFICVHVQLPLEQLKVAQSGQLGWVLHVPDVPPDVMVEQPLLQESFCSWVAPLQLSHPAMQVSTVCPAKRPPGIGEVTTAETAATATNIERTAVLEERFVEWARGIVWGRKLLCSVGGGIPDTT